jgi:hypothetical protein
MLYNRVIVIKSEKAIMSTRVYLTSFVKFLAAFTYNEEGIKAIMVGYDFSN